MYGLVNKAIEDLVCSGHGEETWEKIKSKAGVEVDVFVSNEGYPDEITYKLVGAASEVLGISSEEILHAFGEHWVLYTGREGYGELFEAAGNSFKEFLVNLPNFHTRVTLAYPHLVPPKFKCTNVTDSSLTLHYYSEREGLAPMVAGLLSGLGKKYDTAVKVTQKKSRGNGDEHDEFFVEFESE